MITVGLTPRQKALAELQVLEPNLTVSQYAEKIGCSEKSVYNWRYLQDFTDYEHELCQKRFRELEKTAMKALSILVNNNNFNAVKYVLDGRDYGAEQKINATVSSDINIDG